MKSSGVTQEQFDHEIRHKPMGEYLAERITAARLRKVYDEGLEATIPKTVKVKGAVSPLLPPPEGWELVTVTNEEAVYERHLVDHAERRHMADQVHKLKGDYPASEHHITSDFSQIMADVIGEVDGLSKGKLPSQMPNGDANGS